MSWGKSGGHALRDIDTIGSGSSATSRSSSADARPDRRRTHLCHQFHRGGVVEVLAVVVDRRRRHAGLDQLDAAAVRHLVAGRRRDRDCPAEVVGDAEPHGTRFARPVRTVKATLHPVIPEHSARQPG
jgi:hypothetical protein